ncbi:hypothetical protein BCR41DRAFT_375759 [Lobosporangium transversale]|uniref:Crinkler effector protein N-terminal domain-containing protein n=1 Tax=Lobosporangium transversale TaxID=64571 RepID=A0A1Y2G7P1_9FUNG|nr:hypothetical protein BCR41DRAFT_375759 [Lobosporangium transversale]ORY96115.1 hypothetical protein BCR41DRAFT_375759 [Lobosporangium transversale]|eukprot:XP_021875534.1 hypothetical protein BCR41DRAFT_375759 [Lobosporangium transversale]
MPKAKSARGTRNSPISRSSTTNNKSPAKSKNNESPKPIKLKLFCLVEGEPAFSVIIRSDQTIDDLKDAIKAKNENAFNGTDAKDLILKLIPNGSTVEELCKFPKESLKVLDNVLEELHTYFPDGAADNPIYIIVEVPKRVSKRDRDQLENDESDRSSSKKVKLETMSLLEAISATELAQKAIINGVPDPSVLSSKELVSVLDNTGTSVTRNDLYYSIPRTAISLQNASFQEIDVISSPWGTKFPVLKVRDLYVRSAFKELYDKIINKFGIDRDIKPDAPQMVLTGTAGIGKSSFLVYFAIRLLATSNEEDPPIIIIQQKEDTMCYAFGGRSVIRYGDIEHFRPFLDLPSTWFLVDSSPAPKLMLARTIFSVSPKTLNSEENLYKEIVKGVPWKYYMAPWELDELKECRDKVEAFHMVPEDFMEHLYEMIGEVQRVGEASPDVKWFNTLECYKDKMQGSLWIPNSKRFACVDMLLAPNYLLQVTTNKDHGIKSKPFKAFLKSMRENKWIHSSEEVALIFVVPQDQIKEFKKQNFKTGTNRVDSKATKELLDVKQYIMGIDLQAELRQAPRRMRTRRTRTER